MITTSRWLLILYAVVPAVSVLAQTPAPTEDGAKGKQRIARDLEEVIVTAQRREERLQDVPISISALGGEQLDQLTDRGVAEALNRVPGVVNLSLGAGERFGGNTTVAVRGVPGGGLAVGGSAAAYYLDSIPFGFIRQGYAPDSNAFDLERVEVLRGPQGTLYGASALNGVVRVLTRDAHLDQREFKVRTAASGTQDGGESYRGDLAANIPIVEGKVAARAVVGYQDLAGWIDKSVEKDANDRQVGNGRLKIKAKPTDELSIDLFAWMSRTDIGAPSHSADGRHSLSVVSESGSIDYDAYGGSLRYDFPAFSLVSTTSYVDFDNESNIDISAFAPGTLHSIFASKVFAEEVNLNSAPDDGPWRWSLGGIYRDAKDQLWQLRSVAYLAPTDQRTTSKSFAVFGELTRAFFDGKFELTGGLRYFEDKVQDIERSRLTVVGGVPPEGLAVTPEHKFDKLSPRAVIAWHPSDQLSIYASYAEGFRSGLNQLPAVTAAAPEFPPVDPDELQNYELGAKGNLWGGRVQFDTALFYIDWQGVQQSFTVLVRPPSILMSALVNAGSVSGAGAEFGITVEATDGLTLSANMSWNDLKVDDNVTNAAGAIILPKDARLAGSARSTAGASAEYAFPLGQGGWNAQFSLSANYTSNLVLGRTSAGPVIRGSTVLSRTSFAVTSPNAWTTSLFVDNLGNESGFSRDPFTIQWSNYLRPRTIGLQLEYQF